MVEAGEQEEEEEEGAGAAAVEEEEELQDAAAFEVPAVPAVVGASEVRRETPEEDAVRGDAPPSPS